MATSSPKFVTMASLLAITMPEGQVHLAQVHHSVISVQTILLIQMFSVSLKLFILASAAADADADGALHLEALLRAPVNNIEYFPPNFEGLVLGCIDADF